MYMKIMIPNARNLIPLNFGWNIWSVTLIDLLSYLPSSGREDFGARSRRPDASPAHDQVGQPSGRVRHKAVLAGMLAVPTLNSPTGKATGRAPAFALRDEFVQI
jgi:hypothetical protein